MSLFRYFTYIGPLAKVCFFLIFESDKTQIKYSLCYLNFDEYKKSINNLSTNQMSACKLEWQSYLKLQRLLFDIYLSYKSQPKSYIKTIKQFYL